MSIQRYSANPHSIENVLQWTKLGEIAIPEIQRPFVWKPTKVRDLIDSLYHGYPVGYLIMWQNPNVLLKDGTQSVGKRILIDGQQRVISLEAALLGKEVVNKNYKRIRIVIAFHPIEERFEVANSAIKKNAEWISDISTIFDPELKVLNLLDEYCEHNPEVDKTKSITASTVFRVFGTTFLELFNWIQIWMWKRSQRSLFVSIPRESH